MIPTATAPQLNPHPSSEARLQIGRLGECPAFLKSPNPP
jgi:hypothetical protein